MKMNQRYHPSQILLHAVIGLLIVLTFAFGKYVASLPLSPAKFQLISYHKWGGIIVLLLVVVLMASVAPAPQGEGLAKDIGSGVGLHVIMLAAVTALPGLLGFALLPTLICHCNQLSPCTVLQTAKALYGHIQRMAQLQPDLAAMHRTGYLNTALIKFGKYS